MGNSNRYLGAARCAGSSRGFRPALVDAPVSLPPVIELAGGHAQPRDEPSDADLGLLRPATLGAGTTTTQVDDPNLPNINWTGAKIHFWSGTDPWDPQTGTITASSQGQLTFTVDGASFPSYIEPTPGGYYYLYRLLGALDTQNEWFYDSGAGILYFWTPGGVNPSTLTVTAKQRQYAFDLSGDSNVTIENINLFASTINMDASSANNTLDGINAQYISQFTDLPDVSGFPHSYWYDYESTSGLIINGTGNILQNSTISYSAGNGVALIGSNNTIRNNLIHHVDYIGNYCAGIGFSFVNGNEIVNNTIHNSGRSAIDPESGDLMDIGYNNFFDAMMLSRDGGEIYTGLIVTSSPIHDNWFHDTQSLITGPADNYPLAGVYIDEDASGWEVDQNVLWNNQDDSIALVGSNTGRTNPNNNNIHNNSIPDVNPTAYILTLFNTTTFYATCGTTQIVDNLVLVPITQQGTVVCPATNNSATAPGATDMNGSVQVGCNFTGCASAGPPAISGSSVAASIAVQPYNMTVSAGQPVTFSVTGAGSGTLTYQWHRNGSTITGATSATCTISATEAADNRAVFTVTVSNSLGSVTSNPATLTVD